MRAIAIQAFGGRDQLQLMDLPKPTPSAGEVLIRIKATSLNPVDWKIREGRLQNAFPYAFPIILGWDAAGVVEETGPETSRFKVGDEVYAYCRLPKVQNGTYAEYIALPEKNVALKPKKLSFAEASAIPLAALTSWQVLFDKMELQAGQSILIHSAAGGVGGFATQLALWKGAKVLGTASAANAEYLRQQGIIPIDYNQDLESQVKAIEPAGVDGVFDTFGGEWQKKSVAVLKEGGSLVSISSTPNAELLAPKKIKGGFVFVSPNGAQLEELAKLADEGKLKVVISSTYKLEDAAKALEQLEGGHTKGKIVLEV